MINKKCLLSIFVSMMTTFLFLKPISVKAIGIEDQNITDSIDIDLNDLLEDEIISETIQDEKIIYALNDDEYANEDSTLEQLDFQVDESQSEYSVQEDNVDIVTGTISDEKIDYVNNDDQMDETDDVCLDNNIESQSQVNESIQDSKDSNNGQNQATNTGDCSNTLAFTVVFLSSIFAIKKLK